MAAPAVEPQAPGCKPVAKCKDYNRLDAAMTGILVFQTGISDALGRFRFAAARGSFSLDVFFVNAANFASSCIQATLCHPFVGLMLTSKSAEETPWTGTRTNSQSR